MNEFSFYHIVNKHSKDAKIKRASREDSDVRSVSIDTPIDIQIDAPIKSTPYPNVMKPVTRKNKRCIFHNICCFVATIMTAIVAFGMMALFALVA